MKNNKPESRGMVFSSEAIRRILSGIKIETRRPLLTQPYYTKDGLGNETWFWRHPHADKKTSKYLGAEVVCETAKGETRDDFLSRLIQYCPYGGVGDQLWIQEKLYQDDDDRLYYFDDRVEIPGKHSLSTKGVIYPRFMPRQCARYFLRIKYVGTQYFSDINEDDAIAEGFVGDPHTQRELYFRSDKFVEELPEVEPYEKTAHFQFARWWDVLYKSKPELQTITNPLVFVIGFEFISKKGGS